jgi:hypothetical protein
MAAMTSVVGTGILTATQISAAEVALETAITQVDAVVCASASALPSSLSFAAYEASAASWVSANTKVLQDTALEPCFAAATAIPSLELVGAELAYAFGICPGAASLAAAAATATATASSQPTGYSNSTTTASTSSKVASTTSSTTATSSTPATATGAAGRAAVALGAVALGFVAYAI